MGSYLSKTKDGETRFSTSISIETRPVCCSTVKDDSDDSPIVLIAQKALGKIGENSKEACPDSLNLLRNRIRRKSFRKTRLGGGLGGP